MKLINERTQVRTVAARWRENYGPKTQWAKDQGKQAIQAQLDALDVETATAADVDAIIGVGGWCMPQTCADCGESARVLVELGEEPDYDSCTANICVSCLKAALKLVKQG